MGMIVSSNGFMRVIEDDMNPRVQLREFKCAECREWVAEDDAVWIDPKTGKATMDGSPFHVSCGPPEKEEQRMMTFNIYFSDLNEDAQQRLLARMGCTDAMEMNWDRDIVPLAIFETEDESEPEELEPMEDEPYDPGPGERRVEEMIREEEYRRAGQDPHPLNMEED